MVHTYASKHVLAFIVLEKDFYFCELIRAISRKQFVYDCKLLVPTNITSDDARRCQFGVAVFNHE
jgi:hypothetical protein